MTDTAGLVPAPGYPQVDGRYTPFSAVRLGIFAGIRALGFVTVQGFDAITAAQDIGRGVQFGVFAGPSVWESQHGSDYFLSGDFYAGVGTESSFLQVRMTAEGRVDRLARKTDGLVGWGKLVWYTTPSESETRIATLELSGVQNLAFPLQLA